MKKNFIDKLCCAICKSGLEVNILSEDANEISEARLTCLYCGKQFVVKEGIPRMYISDEEAIRNAKIKRFSNFIITKDFLNIFLNKKHHRETFLHFLTNNRKITEILIIGAWLSSIFCLLALAIRKINRTDLIGLEFTKSLLLISALLFSFDYLRHRIRARLNFISDMNCLSAVAEKNKLSEHDIKFPQNVEEIDSESVGEEAAQKRFVDFKGLKISLLLEKYNSSFKEGLAVGCGGELHSIVSKPYFDRKINMTGVDVQEGSLKDFKRIFDASVVLANALALPFKGSVYDIINYTDIIEHLHHPFLGLLEARRVLKRLTIKSQHKFWH